MGFLALSRERSIGSLVPQLGSKGLFSLHAASSGHLATSPPAQRCPLYGGQLQSVAGFLNAGQELRLPQNVSPYGIIPACWVCGSRSFLVLGVYTKAPLALPHSSTTSSSPAAQSGPLVRAKVIWCCSLPFFTSLLLELLCETSNSEGPNSVSLLRYKRFRYPSTE